MRFPLKTGSYLPLIVRSFGNYSRDPGDNNTVYRLGPLRPQYRWQAYLFAWRYRPLLPDGAALDQKLLLNCVATFCYLLRVDEP